MSQVFKQDLTDTSDRPGGIFFVELLMAEHCDIIDREHMVEVFTKHLGTVDCFSYGADSAGFAPQNYKVHYEDNDCLLYTSPSPRDYAASRMPSSA